MRDLYNIIKWRELPKIFRYKKIYQYIIDDDFSIDCSIVRTSQKSNSKMSVNNILKYNLVKNVIKPSDVSLPFTAWWKNISKNKSAEVTVKNAYKYFKSIKESKVFENSMSYEIETELIYNTVENVAKFEKDGDQVAVIRNKLISFFKYITILFNVIKIHFI